jgi:hypothetical protein
MAAPLSTNPRRWPPLPAILAMALLIAPLTRLQVADDPAEPSASATATATDEEVTAAVPATASPPASGTFALAGTILDASGAAVVGAMVSAELELPSIDPSLPPTLPQRIPAATDARGAFLLPNLVPGRHRIRVEGLDIFTSEVRMVAVPGDPMQLVVARQVTLTGRVIDQGAPVAGATVQLTSDDLGLRVTTCDVQGTFHFSPLPEGHYHVAGWKGDLASRTTDVSRSGPGPFAAVELTVEPAAIVVGRVLDADEGRGIEAAVELRALDHPGEMPRHARTDASGVFRVEGIPHGRWLVDGFRPGWVSSGGVEFSAGRGIPEVELSYGGVIVGRVIDARGQPVAGAVVSSEGTIDGSLIQMSVDAEHDQLRRFSGFALAPAQPTAASPASGGEFVTRGELGVLLGAIPFPPPPGARMTRAVLSSGSAATPVWSREPAPIATSADRSPTWTTGADGVFRITGLRRARWTVVVSAAGYSEGRSPGLVLGPGDHESRLEVRLARGVFVSGTVANQRGAAVVGATIAALHGARTLEAVSDGAGQYRLGPITGTVELMASAFGHGTATRTVRTDMTADGADQRWDFMLAVADAEVLGTVSTPDGAPVLGARIAVIDGAATGRSSSADAQGFRIDQLPAGKHRVRITHPDLPPHETTVSTDAAAHLTIPWGGGIAGLVFDRHNRQAVPGVTVIASGPGGARVETAVDPSGKMTIAPLLPGRWVLTVTQPGYLPLELGRDVPAGDRIGAVTVDDVHLELERGAHLAGTVRDSYGNRLAGARVVARRTAAPSVHADARTDASGEFRLRDAPTGEVEVTADKGGMSGAHSIQVRPGEELLSLEIVVR